MSTIQNPKALISIVMAFVIMVAFGAIILANIQSGMTSIDAYQNNSQVKSIVDSLFNNAWIAFTILGVAILIIIAYFIIRLF